MQTLGGVGNGAVERGPSCAQAERCDHQARIAEHGLRLNQSLAFDAANEPVGIDINVVERQRRRVAQADAVLVFRFVVGETLHAFFHDEPARTAGRVGQNRVGIGDTTVADPLLVAVDLVADDAVVLGNAFRRGAKRPQIAARFRLRGAVGEQQSLFGDARQPDLLLLRSGADKDRIAAQERGQHGGGDAQIDARHFFADAIHIEGAAAHAAELFRNEQELNAQLVRAAHVTNDFQRAFVAIIELPKNLVRQAFLGEVLERLQT